MNKPFDSDFLKNPLPESSIESERPRLTHDLQRMMSSMDNTINIKRRSLLSEIFLDEEQETNNKNGEDQNGEA